MRAARPSAIKPPSLRGGEDTAAPGVEGVGTSYASRMVSRGPVLAAPAAAVICMLLSACGGGSSGKDSTTQKPPAVATPQSFPSPNGKSIAQIREGLGPGPVLAPAVSILKPGKNRFAFGLFD